MASWWNPVSWWDSLSGVAQAVGRDVANFVNNAVHSAIDLVENDISDLWNTAGDWVNHALNYAADIGNQLYADLNSGLQWAENRAVDLFNRVEQQASDWVNQAIGDFERGLNSVESWVSDQFGRIESTVAGWINSAIQQAHDLVDWAIQQANDALHSAFDFLYRNVIGPLEQAVNDILDFVAAPIHFVENELTWAYHLITSVAGWLEFIAKLPFEGLHDFESLLADRLTLSNILGHSPNIADAAADVERAIAHIIG